MPLYQVVADPEGGGALGGVQDPQPPGGARAEVEEPPAVPDGAYDQVHGPGDLRDFLSYRLRNNPVLRVDQLQNPGRIATVDFFCPAIDPLGQ